MRYQDARDPSQQTQWYVSEQVGVWNWERWTDPEFDELHIAALAERDEAKRASMYLRMQDIMEATGAYVWIAHEPTIRSEEHTSELQSLMRISYAVFCLKKTKQRTTSDT